MIEIGAEADEPPLLDAELELPELPVDPLLPDSVSAAAVPLVELVLDADSKALVMFARKVERAVSIALVMVWFQTSMVVRAFLAQRHESSMNQQRKLSVYVK